jgi:hypothetical protein
VSRAARDNGACLGLHERVDDVLRRVWDPIGIASEPGARDEYRNYVPRVVGMLCDGADEAALSAYLAHIATVSIGVPADEQHAANVARLLIEAKARWDRAS